eukprot:362462-Chlamydomonas_euryale.AAC.4
MQGVRHECRACGTNAGRAARMQGVRHECRACGTNAGRAAPAVPAVPRQWNESAVPPLVASQRAVVEPRQVAALAARTHVCMRPRRLRKGLCTQMPAERWLQHFDHAAPNCASFNPPPLLHSASLLVGITRCTIAHVACPASATANVWRATPSALHSSHPQTDNATTPFVVALAGGPLAHD